MKQSTETAQVIAVNKCHIKEMLVYPKGKTGHQFFQTYSLIKGLKKFGEKGRKAAFKEIKQLHDRIVFKPIHVSELTNLERRRAMENLILLAEKRDGIYGQRWSDTKVGCGWVKSRK